MQKEEKIRGYIKGEDCRIFKRRHGMMVLFDDFLDHLLSSPTYKN